MSETMHKPFIIIGAGGHAKVVADLLLEMGEEVLGLTDADPARQDHDVLGLPVLGDDSVLQRFAPDSVNLALGIGAAGKDLCAALMARYGVGKKLQALGYGFPALIHLDAIVGRGCVIDDGAQVMAGAVVQADSHIGSFAIVNSRASIDHDGRAIQTAHIAPRTVMAGGVAAGEGADICTADALADGIRRGPSAAEGAGEARAHRVGAGV